MSHHEEHAAAYRGRVTLWLTSGLWVFAVVVALSRILGSVVELTNGDLTVRDVVWAVVMVLVLAGAAWAAPKLARELSRGEAVKGRTRS